MGGCELVHGRELVHHHYTRVSDVNSPVFLQFWFCYIKSQFLFSIFCYNNYGSSLHYPKLKKKFNSPGHRFTQRAVVISYKNIYYL